AVLAYQGDDPMELCAIDHPDTEPNRLWSRYIMTVTSREYAPTTTTSEGPPRYSEAQVRRWLGWLAKEMVSRNETELLLHEWSGPPRWQKGVKVALGLVVALTYGLAYALTYGLRAGLAGGLTIVA